MPSNGIQFNRKDVTFRVDAFATHGQLLPIGGNLSLSLCTAYLQSLNKTKMRFYSCMGRGQVKEYGERGWKTKTGMLDGQRVCRLHLLSPLSVGAKAPLWCLNTAPDECTSPNASCLCVPLSHCTSEAHLFCIKVGSKDVARVRRLACSSLKRYYQIRVGGGQRYGWWLQILSSRWSRFYSWFAHQVHNQSCSKTIYFLSNHK